MTLMTCKSISKPEVHICEYFSTTLHSSSYRDVTIVTFIVNINTWDFYPQKCNRRVFSMSLFFSVLQVWRFSFRPRWSPLIWRFQEHHKNDDDFFKFYGLSFLDKWFHNFLLDKNARKVQNNMVLTRLFCHFVWHEGVWKH